MMCMSCLTQHMSGSFMMHVFEEIVAKIGVHLVVGLGSRKERPVVNEYHLECHQLACLSLAGFMLENFEVHAGRRAGKHLREICRNHLSFSLNLFSHEVNP